MSTRLLALLGRALHVDTPANVFPVAVLFLNVSVYAAAFWLTSPLMRYISKSLNADVVTYGYLQSALAVCQVFSRSVSTVDHWQCAHLSTFALQPVLWAGHRPPWAALCHGAGAGRDRAGISAAGRGHQHPHAVSVPHPHHLHGRWVCCGGFPGEHHHS